MNKEVNVKIHFKSGNTMDVSFTLYKGESFRDLMNKALKNKYIVFNNAAIQLDSVEYIQLVE